MANENAVTNIADLWVAVAINVDNEDPFESEEEDQIDGEDVEHDDGDLSEADIFGAGQQSRRNETLHRPSFGSPSVRSALAGSPFTPPTPRLHESPMHRSQSVTSRLDVPPSSQARRFSTTVPSIFSHTGVRTPPAVIEAQKMLALADEVEETGQEPLSPIREGSRLVEPDTEPSVALNEPSLMSQLPLMIIFQYGILALHNTTHDQVFYLYLVS